MTGPRASEGGYDYMMQGLAGWQSLTGEPGGPPTKSGLSLVDLSGGYASAIAIMAGIWRARRDGVGCDCDVSLFETALHELDVRRHLGRDTRLRAPAPARAPPTRRSSRSRTSSASDGWFVVGAAKQVFWERLCDVIGRPELNEDERFSTMAARNEHRDELLPILEEAFAARRADEWIAALLEAGVPASRVNTVAGGARGPADPRAQAASSSTTIRRSARFARSARRCRLAEGDESLERPPARGPTRGEHTEDVLVELCGYSAEQVGELAADGVFGVPGG